MVWLFERGDEVVRLETRYDNQPGEYVVDIKWAMRPAETERYRDYAAFHARIVTLERQLEIDRWRQIGSPEILPSGWRGPIPH